MDIISGTPDQIAAKILSRQTSAKEGSRPVVCGFLHAPTGFVHFEGGAATRLAAPALGSTPPRIDASRPHHGSFAARDIVINEAEAAGTLPFEVWLVADLETLKELQRILDAAPTLEKDTFQQIGALNSPRPTLNPDLQASAHAQLKLTAEHITPALLKHGFKIVSNAPFHFCATKSYETACGPKEAGISVYLSTPHRADCTYESEGRNVLKAESYSFAKDPEMSLIACEKEIDQTYARSLWLKGVGRKQTTDQQKEASAISVSTEQAIAQQIDVLQAGLSASSPEVHRSPQIGD